MSGKSYVPRRWREAVKYDVKMLRPHILGRKALDTARAWLDRDYSGIPSGYCFMADDFTMPVYWYVPDGQGWFRLVRGQCLIVIDFRTLRILGFSLQPDKNYNASVIHTLLKRVFTDWGVPRVLYFERGIWESSRLITGGAKAALAIRNWEYMPLSHPEVSLGFRDIGCRFIHAYRARSKPVERVGGLVQDMMERERGYCGRDERRDCPRTTRAAMDAVKFHRVEHPSVYFYSQAEWMERLDKIFIQYNATIQEGKILAGLSPAQAQEQLQDANRPPLDFDLVRHLLAHWKTPVTVGSQSRDSDRSNGITIKFGKREYVYRNENTGRDKFKRKLAWFNPEEPSILAVTDLNMRNPYSVPLSKSPGALDLLEGIEDVEQLALIEAHESYAKTLYRILKPDFDPNFRRVIPDAAAVETGAAMRQQHEALTAQRKDSEASKRRAQHRAAELGLPSRITTTPDAADEGTRMMLEAKRAHERNGAETATPENP